MLLNMALACGNDIFLPRYIPQKSPSRRSADIVSGRLPFHLQGVLKPPVLPVLHYFQIKLPLFVPGGNPTSDAPIGPGLFRLYNAGILIIITDEPICSEFSIFPSARCTRISIQ